MDGLCADPVDLQSEPPKTEGEESRPAHKPTPSIKSDHCNSTSCISILKFMQPSATGREVCTSFHPISTIFLPLVAKFFENLFFSPQTKENARIGNNTDTGTNHFWKLSSSTIFATTKRCTNYHK